MIKIGGYVVNIGFIPGMLGGTLANRPAPAEPYRLYWSFDTKQIFQDSGTAWTIVIDGSFSPNGYVPYTGALHDVDLVSTGKGLFAEYAEIGHGNGTGEGIYGAIIYNQDVAATGGLLIQAGNNAIPAISVQDLSGSITDFILLFGDGHAIFLSYVQATEFKTANVGGFKASLKSTNLTRNTTNEWPNYSGNVALNATLYQNLRLGLIGTDTIVFPFVASNLTSPAVNGINLVNILTPVNVTAVTTAMTFSLTITYTGTSGAVQSLTLAGGTIAAPGQSANLTISRALLAKTGDITIQLSLTAGSGTFDWMPTIQYVG